MITDTRKKHITFTLVAIEMGAAIVMGMMATLPGLNADMVAILLSTAVLSLTLAIFEIIVYTRHHLGTTAEVYDPQV
jgi:hypothetical protein